MYSWPRVPPYTMWVACHTSYYGFKLKTRVFRSCLRNTLCILTRVGGTRIGMAISSHVSAVKSVISNVQNRTFSSLAFHFYGIFIFIIIFLFILAYLKSDGGFSTRQSLKPFFFFFFTSLFNTNLICECVGECFCTYCLRPSKLTRAEKYVYTHFTRST